MTTERDTLAAILSTVMPNVATYSRPLDWRNAAAGLLAAGVRVGKIKPLPGSVPAGDEPKGEPVNDLIRDGIEAFRLTREYVGEDTLPAIEGWSWFDWCEKAREHLARPVSTPRLTDEQVQAIYAAYDQFGGGEAHTLEGRRSIVEPIADAVRAALAAGVHLTGDAEEKHGDL